jgi:mono/diheme cytochrome c family protein
MRNARATLMLGMAVLALGTAAARAGESDPQNFTQIDRGHYLVNAGDCAGCHTLPGSGKMLAGGRSIETPFGSIATPNITPDRETGIGAWTDEQFDNALRKGIHPNGSRLYPAMPYPSYTKLSHDDVIAIRAYLNTIKPVRHRVVANTLPFPFNIRAAMRIWDWIYFTPGEFKPDPKQSAEWNRGAFLVQGPSHCGACHTPKTVLGGDKTSEYLQGSWLQGWFAPDITSDKRRGIGGWSVDDVVTYLKSGHNRISAATGPMAEEVTLSSSRMNDSDLHAIAAYLQSLPGRQDSPPQPLPANDPTMVAGAAIYRDACSACHMIDGKGVEKLFPSLAESSMVRSDDPTTLVRIILRGTRSAATDTEPTGPGMPSFGWQLNDTQVAAVVTYIRNGFGSAAPPVAADTVKKDRAAFAKRSD